jgi:hypothetical protein
MDLMFVKKGESTVKWRAAQLIGVLLVAGGLLGIGQAQRKSGDDREEGLFRIPVWVEQEGQFWKQGRRDGFRLLLNDEELPVQSFQGPESPTVLLLVFDTVVDLARVDQVRVGLQNRLRELPENHWVGVLRSQDGLRALLEPTADRERLVETIRSVQVNGRAGLLDTLVPVANLASRILTGSAVRVFVLYITDSGIANYRADYLNPVINASDAGDLSRRFSDRAVQEQVSRIGQSLARFAIPFFVLHLEYRPDALNLAYQSGLERIAAEKGGQMLLCRTVDEIAPSLDLMLNRLLAGYYLGTKWPEKGRGPWKVKVELRDRGDARVLHPVQLERPKK